MDTSDNMKDMPDMIQDVRLNAESYSLVFDTLSICSIECCKCIVLKL